MDGKGAPKIPQHVVVLYFVLWKTRMKEMIWLFSCWKADQNLILILFYVDCLTLESMMSAVFLGT